MEVRWLRDAALPGTNDHLLHRDAVLQSATGREQSMTCRSQPGVYPAENGHLSHDHSASFEPRITLAIATNKVCSPRATLGKRPERKQQTKRPTKSMTIVSD
jgi:hypothetical protein